MNKRLIVALAIITGSLGALWFARARYNSPKSHVAWNLTLPTRRPSPTDLAAAFPANSDLVFEHSDRLILYSIKPEGGTTPGLKQQLFHGYPIVGQTEIKDKKISAALVAHFYDGLADKQPEAGCFMPRHAIKAIKGQRQVDLVICFGCGGVDIYSGKQSGHMTVNDRPLSFFNAVLNDANVPLNAE